MLAVAAWISGVFTSCSGNDDESYVPTPIITDANGTPVLVTSVGSYRLAYNEEGKLTGITEGSYTYILKDDKFDFNNGSTKAEVFLNADGLVSRIKYQVTSANEKNEGTTEYTYGPDRRLKSCTVTGEGTYRYGSEEVSYNGKATVDYTWQSDNLIQAKVESKTSSKYDGKSYQTNKTTDYAFAYGTQANTCKQLPYYMSDAISGLANYGGLLGAIGLFGYGPAFLPTSYTETVTEKEDGYLTYGPHTDSYTFSFAQNSNGTLNSEKAGSYQVFYGYTSGTTRAEGFGTPNPDGRVSNIFRRRKQ